MNARLIGLAVLVVAVLAVVPQQSHAGMLIYEVFLDGPSESPPNASPGTGYALITVDDVLKTMRVEVTFSDLIGTTTAAHIHATTAVPFDGTAIAATTTPAFPGFPLGVTSGSYDQTFDMTLAASYNPAFVTANGGMVATAEAALFEALANSRAYLNIHTTLFPGGEIRGFSRPVPEPTSITLWGFGAACLAMTARRRKHRTGSIV